MSITLGLPCDAVSVRVQIAPSEHLTPVEEMALQAIGHGVDTFVGLERLFGLGTRMTQDLIQDLWRRRYVRVDVQRARVVLSPEISRIINQPEKLRELAPGHVEDQVWSLAVELISGQVVPLERATGPKDLLVAPRRTGAWSLEAVPPDALLSAVIASRRMRFPDEPSAPAILAVDLTPRQSSGQRSGPRFLPVVVVAVRDEGGRLRARVAADEPLAQVYRDRIDGYLAEQVEAPEKAQFVHQLAGRATQILAEPPTLSDWLDRLHDRLAKLAAAPHGTWGDHHRAMEELAGKIERDLTSRVAATTQVTFLDSADEQFRAVADAMGRAERQIVLVGPWIEAGPLNELLGPLEKAMGRGVHVVLAWGYNHEDTLTDAVSNLLISASRRYPGRLAYSDRSARTHAKIAVCDDRWALVTSLNVLGSLRHNLEGGVVLSARPGAECPPIEELLRWARDEYPDYPTGRSILVSAQAFRRTGPTPPARRSTGPKTLPEPPGTSQHGQEEALRALWVREWRSVSRDLEQRAHDLPVHIDSIVVGGMHRNRLDDALRTARRRLIIASDQLSREVVGDSFIRLLEERLTVGVHVRLIYRRWGRAISDAGNERITQEFARLAEQHAGAFDVRRVDGWHAKALICDDWAVVGSFNFLSFAGHYREGRRSRRSELSVALTGGDVADQIAASICNLAGVTTPSSASQTTPAGTTVGSDMIQLARSLVEATSLRRRAVLAQLPATTDLDDLLSVLDGANLPAALIAEMAASFLATGRTGPAVERWADRVIAHLWEQGRFVEAMLLRRHHDGGGEPSTWVTELGAFAGSPAFDEWMGADDIGPRTANERTALALAAFVELLAPTSKPQEYALLVLKDLVNDHPDIAALIPPTVLEHWERHGPLPAEFIASSMDALDHEERTAHLARTLRERVERWLNASPPGSEGTRVRRVLSRFDSPASRLLALLDANGSAPAATPLRAWFDQYGSQGADALLTQLETDGKGHTRTHGRWRIRYVDRIVEPVLTAALRLVSELEGQDDSLAQVTAVVKPVLVELAGAMAGIEVAAAGLPVELRTVVDRSLERLRPLLKQVQL